MEGHVDRQEIENAIIRTVNRQGGVHMETTARPWRVERSKQAVWIVADHATGHEVRGATDSFYGGGVLICESVSADNAALIVRTANNHDALVEALESIKAEKCYCYYHWADEHECAHDIARDVLLAVEGGAG